VETFSLLFTGILLVYAHEQNPPLTDCWTTPVQLTIQSNTEKTEEKQYDCPTLFHSYSINAVI